MKPRKCFIDSGVLIAAARGKQEISEIAITILDDPNRKFVSSVFIKLEVLPKAVYHRKNEEVVFYNTYFDAVSHWAVNLENITNSALEYAESYGLGAMDAFHIASAISGGAEEFVTTEKPDKPIHRVPNIRIITLQVQYFGK